MARSALMRVDPGGVGRLRRRWVLEGPAALVVREVSVERAGAATGPPCWCPDGVPRLLMLANSSRFAGQAASIS